MSFLSDYEIMDRCLPINHLVSLSDGKEISIHVPVGKNSIEYIEKRFGAFNVQSINEFTNVEEVKNPMISPFVSDSVKFVDGRKVLSYGLSSYGYDVRLSREIKLFTDINGATLDPKRFDEEAYVDAKIHTDDDGSEYVIMPPHSFILGVTVEYFTIPRDIVVVAVGKSTVARLGLILNVTPLEPEFSGNVVLELSNTTSLPAKIYIDEGIAQFLFSSNPNGCRVSYADRKGKYNFQTGVTPAKV